MPSTPFSRTASWIALLALASLLALGCPPLIYPDAYEGMGGDDDDSAADDDDATGDDDDATGDDDDDDDTGPYNCAAFCDEAKADCIDWNTLGTSCDAFCGQFMQLSHLSCLEGCQDPPPPSVCTCTEDCLADVLPE